MVGLELLREFPAVNFHVGRAVLALELVELVVFLVSLLKGGKDAFEGSRVAFFFSLFFEKEGV